MFWFISTIIILYLYLLLVHLENKKLNKSIDKNSINKKIFELLNIYTRQCIRWTFASTQDKNPIIAVLHADYGNAYLMVIKDYLEYFEISLEIFEKITGNKLKDLENRVIKNQDNALKNLIKTKEIKIENGILSKGF